MKPTRVFSFSNKQDYGALNGRFRADDNFSTYAGVFLVSWIHTNQNDLLMIYLSLLILYDCIFGSYHSKKTQDIL